MHRSFATFQACITLVGLSAAFAIATSQRISAQNLELPVVTSPAMLEANAIERAYSQEALSARLRRDRDPALGVLLLKAVALAKNGRTRNEIILAITEARQAWEITKATGLRQDWEIDEDYTTLIRHVGALAGASYDPVRGSILGEAAADIGIMTTEAFMRDGEILAASRRLGVTYGTIRQSEEMLTKLVYERYRDDPIFREVYDEQFASQVGFVPTDDPMTVSKGFPEFAEQENIREILQLLVVGDANVTLTNTERQQLLGAFSGILGEFDRENDARIAELSATAGRSSQMLEVLLKDQFDAAKQARQDTEERIVFEGRRAALYLATTTLGFIDPELGRQSTTLASAAVEVNRAIKAYDAASKLGKDLSGYASLALTGNLVGTALSLIDAFGSSESSADELIMQEIAKIRQDIADLRINMNERFNIVDTKLDVIYGRLDAGFRDLSLHLERKTGRSLRLVREELIDIQAQQSTINDLIWSRLRLITFYLDEDFYNCVERRLNTIEPISSDRYLDCEQLLGRRLSPSLLGAAQVDVDGGEDPAGRAKELRDNPHGMFRSSLRSYEELAGLESLGPVVGPEQWVIATEAYDTFIDSWPEWRNLILDFNFDDALLEGDRLRSAINTLQSGFVAYSNQQDSPSIEAIVASLHENGEVFARILETEELDYYTSIERPDLHLTEKGTPIELRDIRIEPMRASNPHNLACHQFAMSGVLEPPSGLQAKVPREFREAVDLGVGALVYCVKHHYAQPIAEIVQGIAPDDNQMYEVYVTPAGEGPYTAIVSVAFAWDGSNCGGVKSDQSDYATIVWEATITDQERKAGGIGIWAPPPLSSFWTDDWRTRFMSTVDAATIASAENKVRPSAYSVMQDCLSAALRPVVEGRLRELRQSLSEDLYEQFEQSSDLKNADGSIDLATATLGHWVWAAYNDRLPASDLLSALATGGIRPPSIEDSVVKAKEGALPAWEAVEIYRADLAAYVAFLRSDRLRRHLAPGGDSFGINAVMARMPGEEQ